MQTLCLMLLFACAGPWLLQASAQAATSSPTKAPKGQNAAEDTNGTFHQMAEKKRRFQTAQQHVGNGLKMRAGIVVLDCLQKGVSGLQCTSILDQTVEEQKL